MSVNDTPTLKDKSKGGKSGDKVTACTIERLEEVKNLPGEAADTSGIVGDNDVETNVTPVEPDSLHKHLVNAEKVVEKTLDVTLEEETVKCEDPCGAMIPMTDLKDVKDPDDVSLVCKSDNGNREAGAYTVDAIHHAKLESSTDWEVPSCVILAHSADCITLTPLECPRN